EKASASEILGNPGDVAIAPEDGRQTFLLEDNFVFVFFNSQEGEDNFACMGTSMISGHNFSIIFQLSNGDLLLFLVQIALAAVHAGTPKNKLVNKDDIWQSPLRNKGCYINSVLGR
ncbi:hypothetical protein ACJX0J_024540, partial [Zea mays]